MYKGDLRPRKPPQVMASSAMGLKLGVFADYTRRNKCKQNASPTFMLRAAFHTFISTLRPQYITYFMNHGYFDHRKNQNTPNLSPMPLQVCILDLVVYNFTRFRCAENSTLHYKVCDGVLLHLQASKDKVWKSISPSPA